VLANYYKPLKGKELKYAGIAGMMASLGDPHTMFMPPRQAEQFTTETRANYAGVGARLNPDTLGAKLYRVFAGSPADKAGLKNGDIVVGVNGTSVAGKKIEDIVELIKGEVNTTVHLQIVREGVAKPMTFTVKRARVTIPTVEGNYLTESKIGYLNVSSFSEPTANQFDEELARLEKRPLKGLVIDVRSNPGGLLDSASEMLSRFVENRIVCKMKMRNSKEEVVHSYPGFLKEFGYPVVILVDGDSASAAEIFAGALRDYGLATLVGDHTYGKASVQNVFELTDGSSAKISLARYLLPFNGDISRKVDDDGQYVSGGISPDVLVKLSEEDLLTEPGNPEKDPQLKKAVEIIQAKAK
jgi:carboxyl-terminal processing protease